MTKEEARAEEAEAQRLSAEIARLQNRIAREIQENKNLKAELETLVKNIEILTQGVGTMDVRVNRSMEHVKDRVAEADVSTAELSALIHELTESYFTFKNLSTASKNITQYTDEYYTRFRYFNELRRITLGYVVALDAYICSEESMRKKVEHVYLQNTEYWLAYAIMAVMLWASDEEESAKRAMTKALYIDRLYSSLFFLLINLRFTRIDAAKKWYLVYLERIDMRNPGKEWQYLLQAYLSGVFGVDQEFNRQVEECFTDMLRQMESMNPDYGKQVTDNTLHYCDTYVHVTENEFETLRRYCPQYEELKSLLSAAEKNERLAVHFRTVMESESQTESEMPQRIENILYDLVSAYDKEEWKVIRNRRYNEMIVRARGDVGLAQQFYRTEFSDETAAKPLEDLLFAWAFEEDLSQVDIKVKKFAVGYLEKWLSKGFQAFGEGYRKREKDRYKIAIDGWEADCSEDSYSEAEAGLTAHYHKNRLFETLKDKYVLIFIGMIVASLLALAVTAVYFHKVVLVIGILLGVVGGFLLWRRISDLQMILQARCDHGCQILKKALEELRAWRKLYRDEDEKQPALVHVFEQAER